MLWPLAKLIYHQIQPSSAGGKKLRACQHLVGAKQFLSRTTVSNACVAFIMVGMLGKIAFDVVEGKEEINKNASVHAHVLLK